MYLSVKNIYKKLILTNAFPPETNIDLDEFIGLKINWLIKNNDLVFRFSAAS